MGVSGRTLLLGLLRGALGETEIPCGAPGCSFVSLPLFICLLPASRAEALEGITAAVPLAQCFECLTFLPRWPSGGERKVDEALLPRH